ncbi:MAG: hypothetical protein H0W94_01400 [Actinobacteria bacterium]|nr:hypothetical protein [Actinomycetota bacterium]
MIGPDRAGDNGGPVDRRLTTLRWAASGLAALVGLALGSYPFVLAPASQRLVLVAVLALLVLAGTLSSPRLHVPGAAAGLLTLEYCVALLERGEGLDPLAPVVAVLLFLLLELLDLAATGREGSAIDGRIALNRSAWMLAAAAGGGLAAGAVLLTGALLDGEGPLAMAVAVAIAFAALAIPAWAARRALGNE